ncbi:MAG: PilN domain-containing protein [Syntrophobacterales bacterium]|nr:PilN domain-containing protein [Syntrophobacterales bacterium]
MIRLNLLRKKRVVKPRGLMWQFWLYIAVVFVIIAGVSTIWVFQKKELEKLSMEKARLETEIKIYEKYEKIIRELQTKLNDVKKRSEVIASLIADRDNVVRLLALLALTVPEDSMWFEEVRFSGGDVAIMGVAKSNEKIVEFMRNLESTYFVPKEGTNLVRTRSEEYFGHVLRRFELNFKYNSFSQVESIIKNQEKSK